MACARPEALHRISFTASPCSFSSLPRTELLPIQTPWDSRTPFLKKKKLAGPTPGLEPLTFWVRSLLIGRHRSVQWENSSMWDLLAKETLILHCDSFDYPLPSGYKRSTSQQTNKNNQYLSPAFKSPRRFQSFVAASLHRCNSFIVSTTH